MNSIYRCILPIVFCLFAEILNGQDLIINSESVIKDIGINADGRLHLLYPNKLCDFEGKEIVNECLPVNDDVSFVLPINDGYYALFYENKIKVIKNNQLLSTDTFPDIVTVVSLYKESILVGTAGSGLHLYGLNSNTSRFIGLKEEFINDLIQLNGKTFIALDNGIAKYDPISEKIKNRPLPVIVSHLSGTTNNSVFAINVNGKVFRLNENLDLLAEKKLNGYNIERVSTSLNTTFFTTPDACYQMDTAFYVEKIAEGHYQNILALANNLLLSKENKLYTHDLTTQVIESNSEVFSIFSENDTILWVGSVNRINKFSHDRLVGELNIPTSLPNVFVSALLVNDTHIFVGTMGDGLFVLNKKGQLLRHILDERKNNRNNIIQLNYEKGMVWVAYLNGLTTIDPQTLNTIKDYDEIQEKNYLYCIEPIEKNEFYIGTSSDGILHYKNGKIRNYLGNNSVYCLSKSKLGLLAGTKETGTFLLNDTLITSLNREISPRAILGLNDLVFFCLKNQSLLYSDGTIIPVFNGILKDVQLNAITQNRYSIYVGYANGILKVNKERLGQLTNIGLHLNQPSLFDKLIAENKHRFEYFENSFSFTFHPNTYYKISNTIYRYRLTGLDTNWLETQQNKINFYNLSPGKYTFEVSCAFTNKSAFANIQRYTFEISKPFWETAWFITVVSLLTAFIIFIAIRRREQRLLRKSEQQQEKIKFELQQLKNQIDPHFLFNSFNSLIGLIEEDPQSAIASTQLLSDLYRNILTYDKLDFIALETELELAYNYFHMHQIRFEELVELNIDVPDTENCKLIPLSCQFLIENAIKHNIINSNNRLSINIKRENNYLVVSNTLNPKQKNKHNSTGLGLENLKARYVHFTQNPVIVETTANLFIVKLPIISDQANHI